MNRSLTVSTLFSDVLIIMHYFSHTASNGKAWLGLYNPGKVVCTGSACNSKLLWTVAPYVFSHSSLPNSVNVNGDDTKRCILMQNADLKEEDCDLQFEVVCQCDTAPAGRYST